MGISGSKQYQNPKIARNLNSLSFHPPPPGGTSSNAQRIGWYLLNHPRRIFLASPSAETVAECTILPDSNSRYASAAERTLTFICSYGSRFTLPLLNPLARKTCALCGEIPGRVCSPP